MGFAIALAMVPRALPLLGTLLLAACSFDSVGGQPGTGQTQQEVSACFFTDTAIYCAADPGWNGEGGSDLRVRVEDFYPSACADHDTDGDRIPDFMDIDGHGGDRGDDDGRDDDRSGPGSGDDDDDDDDEGHGRDGGPDDDGGDDHGKVDDHLRCRPCNRGPGTSGDFRLDLSGDEAKLDRGRVYLVDGSEIVVPTPEGALTIILSPDTRIDDGDPAPGAEIRAEGAMSPTGELHADRIRVLCRAPAPMPADEVPPDSEPVTPSE